MKQKDVLKEFEDFAQFAINPEELPLDMDNLAAVLEVDGDFICRYLREEDHLEAENLLRNKYPLEDYVYHTYTSKESICGNPVRLLISKLSNRYSTIERC